MFLPLSLSWVHLRSSRWKTALDINVNGSDPSSHLLYTIFRSLHWTKLQERGGRPSTSVIMSRVTFFFSRSGSGVNHFCKRSFPCRLNSNRNCIWKRTEAKVLGSLLQKIVGAVGDTRAHTHTHTADLKQRQRSAPGFLITTVKNLPVALISHL